VGVQRRYPLDVSCDDCFHNLLKITGQMTLLVLRPLMMQNGVCTEDQVGCRQIWRNSPVNVVGLAQVC